MLRIPARLPWVALSIFMLPLSVAGCYATRHQTFGPSVSLDSATSVTTLAGAEILFARPGATIARDTMFAAGTLGDLEIPTDSIAQVNSRGYSGGSSLAVIGAFAAAVAALLYVAAGYAAGGS